MINADIIKALEAIPVLEGPGGVRYIRASDLPNTVRPEFERWTIGSKAPDIPGEMPGDPICEDDYVAWLNALRP